MGKEINVRNKRDVTRSLNFYKERDRGHFEVRLKNVHLRVINELLGETVFRKNDVYVDASTLYEIMQKGGRGGSHHHHGIAPSELADALIHLTKPYCVLSSYENRYAIIVTTKAEKGECMMAIIEPNHEQKGKRGNKINKLITIYPKDKIESVIRNKPKEIILYQDKTLRLEKKAG